MHIRSDPSFFLAKSIGAPYGDDECLIRLLLNSVSNCSLRAASSTLSRGYSFLRGGSSVVSFNYMKCYWDGERLTGKVGSSNTVGKSRFISASVSLASYNEAATSPSPKVPYAERWVK